MPLQIGLTNAALAMVLALAVAGVARWCGRPVLVHALWLLVLLKLVTPPLVIIPIAWPADAAPKTTAADAPVIRTEVPEARQGGLASTQPVDLVDLDPPTFPPLEEKPSGALQSGIEFPPIGEEPSSTPDSI